MKIISHAQYLLLDNKERKATLLMMMFIDVMDTMNISIEPLIQFNSERPLQCVCTDDFIYKVLDDLAMIQLEDRVDDSHITSYLYVKWFANQLWPYLSISTSLKE